MENLCRLPFAGFTLNPDGSIVLCCSSANVPLGHISQIDDLEEWFNNSSHINKVRDMMKMNILPPKECLSCIYKRQKKQTASIDDWVKYHPWKDEWLYAKRLSIEWLEMSAGNICNQSCAMCGSSFSSKWVNIDKKAKEEGLDFRFDNNHRSLDFFNQQKVHKLSQKDLDKILKILPKIKKLTIKGGEPLADPVHIPILKESINYDIDVHITTNFSNVSDDQMYILSNIKNFSMNVSMDGLHDVYKWVRSTSFDKTLNNMIQFHKFSKKRFCVSASCSIFTYFDMIKFINFFKQYDFIKNMNFNTVSLPRYTSPQMIPEYMLNKLTSKYKTFSKVNEKFLDRAGNFYNIASTERDSINQFNSNAPYVIRWIEFLNKQRGFDIMKYVPQLHEVKDYYLSKKLI